MLLGALFIQVAVIAAHPAHVPPPTKNCEGVHCAPLASKAPASDTRFGAENLDAARDRAGLDTNNRPYGGSDADRRGLDAARDTGFDRQGYDNSGTWPAH